MTTRTTRRLTGGHVALMLIGFFAVVVAVNLLMATLATRTFGGTVVDSSYVASQRYNEWLKQGREQAALGWTLSTSVGADGRLRVSVADAGRPLGSAHITARIEHPLGRTSPVSLIFRADGMGGYVADRPLDPGRWNALFSVAHGQSQMRVKKVVSY